MLDQNRAPVYEALEEMRQDKLVPFDVPGHKRGKGNKELTDFLGERCMSVDVNSTKYLDSLGHPTGIIKEAACSKSMVRSMMEPSLRPSGAVMVPEEGVILPREIPRYSRWISRFRTMVARILPLTKCFAMMVRPEVL